MRVKYVFQNKHQVWYQMKGNNRDYEKYALNKKKHNYRSSSGHLRSNKVNPNPQKTFINLTANNLTYYIMKSL